MKNVLCRNLDSALVPGLMDSGGNMGGGGKRNSFSVSALKKN